MNLTRSKVNVDLYSSFHKKLIAKMLRYGVC